MLAGKAMQRYLLVCCIFTFFMIWIYYSWIKDQVYGEFSSCADNDESCNECENNPCDQNDIRLIDLIRKKYLVHPPPRPKTLKDFKEVPVLEGKILGQPRIIDEILHGKRNGFFVEAGGYSEEDFSNSLFFELKRNWTGLLIESRRRRFERMKEDKRKAYMLHAVLAAENKSGSAEVIEKDFSEFFKILEQPELKKKLEQTKVTHRKVKVKSFPLYPALRALGNPVVDYLSLDVNGSEIEILKTIPFNRIRIRTMTIEFNGDFKLAKGLIWLLDKQGYTLEREIFEQELVFVHESVTKMQSKPRRF